MDSTVWVVLGLAVGVPTVFALVIGIIWFAGRPRPRPGLGPEFGTWNAEVLGRGVLDKTYGTMSLREDALVFVLEGADAPAWSVPCRDLVVRRSDVFSQSDVELLGPWGSLRCTVSREHINRVSANDLKTLREGSYATEFVQALAACGARVG